MGRENNQNEADRLAHLEMGHAKMQAVVANLGEDIHSLRSAVEDSNKQLFAKIDALSHKGQITPNILFGFITMAIAVLGVAGTLHMMSLKPIENATEFNRVKILELKEDVKKHLEAPGHMDALIFVAEQKEANKRFDASIVSLEKAVDQIDTSLQREIRLIDATTNVRLDALDNRLQREMVDKLAVLQAKIDGMNQQLNNHVKEANHPYGVLVELERVRAELNLLKGRVDNND